VTPLKKKISCQCPCGYSFEGIYSKNQAILLVQLHVESAHKNLLPFGITKNEALTLLKLSRKEKKQTAYPKKYAPAEQETSLAQNNLC
jgi:hypothetical protein